MTTSKGTSGVADVSMRFTAVAGAGGCSVQSACRSWAFEVGVQGEGIAPVWRACSVSRAWIGSTALARHTGGTTAVAGTAHAGTSAAACRSSVGSSVPSETCSSSASRELDKRIALLKTGEERYVLGVVLEPETVDAQSDIYSAAEVREAAHRFMEEYQNVGLMHRDLVNGKVKILESYVAPAPFDVAGGHVKKGTWLLAVRVVDNELWRQIKAGELSGWSIGGSAVRSAQAAVT